MIDPEGMLDLTTCLPVINDVDDVVNVHYLVIARSRDNTLRIIEQELSRDSILVEVSANP